MRKGTKFDLLPCLESVTPKSKCAEIPNTVTAGTVDAPCLVLMIYNYLFVTAQPL